MTPADAPDQEPAVGQTASVEPPIGGFAKPVDLTPSQFPLLGAATSQFVNDLNPLPMVKTAFGGPSDPMTNVVNAMIASSAQRLAAARAASASGDHAGAALHYVGAIPVLGPAVDDLLTALRSGDKLGAAKAMGSLAALAVPAVTGVVGDLGTEAPATPARAGTMEDAAASRIASTMDPANNWGKTKKGLQQASQADAVAPSVLAAGPTSWTRQGLRDFIGRQFQASSDAWDAAEANRQVGRPIDVHPIIAQLQAKIDDLTSQPIQGSLPQRASVTTTSPILDAQGHPIQTTSQMAQPIGAPVTSPTVGPQIAVLQKAIAQLKDLGGPNGIADFDALRTMRQGADAGANYKEALGATSDQNTAARQTALGNRGVAGSIRDTLAAADPGLAAANANFSMWQKANDVAQAAQGLDRVATRGGKFATTARLMGPLLGTEAGFRLGGTEGAAAGAAGGLLAVAMDAAQRGGFTTKIATARVLDTLASAIKAGDAATIARSMAALASVTGTTVPAVNQAMGDVGSPLLHVPQTPVNVAVNSGGGS